MITLITGTPGAGKTLYCVSHMLRDLCGSSVETTNTDGVTVSIPRIVYTNIKDLQLEHELINGDVGGGLADWHEWAKPGAVICYDEVQKEWPVRPNGSKVPDCIKALETHRHMGVDIIVITQGPNLIDQNLRSLVNRHLHVRRLGGIGGSVVYEWDHCSRSLLYKNALTKKPFRYPKDVYSLYKSSELHTKPKTNLPAALPFAVLMLVGAAVAVPYTINRISGKADQHAQAQKDTKQTTPPTSEKVTKDSTRHIPIPDLPRDIEAAMPPPPIPLEALEYQGTMQSAKGYLHLFRTHTGIIKSDTLQAKGYKVSSEDGCNVSLSYGTSSRDYICPLGPSAPATSRRAPVDPALLDRLIKERPIPPQPLKTHQWSDEGLAYARNAKL